MVVVQIEQAGDRLTYGRAVLGSAHYNDEGELVQEIQLVMEEVLDPESLA